MLGDVDFLTKNVMVTVLIGGEIGLWVLVLAGLVARYLLRLKRVGLALLAATPLVDLAVLVASTVDLASGAKATLAHGLAAVYIGFSVVFGPSMVRWADRWFAHRFAGGPRPVKKTGREKIRHEWREWGKCVLACVLSAALLLIAIALIGAPERVSALWGWLPRLGVFTGIWFVTGPLWQAVFGAREPEPAR